MVTIRKPKNALKFSKPASWWGSTWRDALPCGNGVIGAAVTGGAANDVVMINHSDLWWQGHVGVLQDISGKITDVKKKIDDGHFKDAESILSGALITKGYRPLLSYPLPLCDFKIEMKPDKQIKEYSRILNMENGEISVTFKDGTTRFERSMFVSQAQNLIAYEITHTGPKTIDVNFSFDVHDKFNNRTPGTVSKTPDGVNVKYDKFFMYFSARSDNGTEFGAVAFVNHYGGAMAVNSDSLSIKGADKVLVLLKPFIESQREKEWKAITTQLQGVKLTYEKLLKEHTPIHSRLFNSAEVDFDAEGRDKFTDYMIDDVFTSGEISPALLEKIWAYGRYLTVCGSKKGSRPLAPYGLWCGDYKAQDSQIAAAASLQTLYSHVLAGNMTEFLESVFVFYESVFEDLKKNASRIYSSRGILIPAIMAHGTGVFGSLDNKVMHFTGAAGWICQLFYDYYLYMDDKNFLKNRALPFMKETALFYENFLKSAGDGPYETSPSFSPESYPGNLFQGETISIARNSSIDFSIAKELLQNLINGSEIAGINKPDIPKWQHMLTKIPEYQINSDNTVKEYLDSRLADNLSMPSSPMFYPVYPGTEINSSKPELFKAFENTLKKKAQSAVKNQTSMSLSRYANIFARLSDGNSAMETIASTIRGMAMSNLIFTSSDWRGMGIGNTDNWASYTIEPNMGITSAIQEMLIQSDSSTIKLLPAITEELSKGEINGFLTRTGAEIVSMAWDKKKGSLNAKIKSRRSVKVNIVLPSGAKKMKPVGKETVDYESGLVSNLELPAGKVIVLDLKF